MTTQAPQQGERRPPPPKPLPRPENKGLTKPFWDATKRGELVMQRCVHCANWIFYPREQCPFCMSQELTWAPVTGRGRVYAFTIVYQSAHPAFQQEAPYVFAVIQLDEGVRMVSNVIGIPPDQVKVDMPVRATFQEASPDWTLVKFEPIPEGQG